MRPEIASQELDALFVSLEGMSIFPLASLLENGEPVPDDGPIDTIGVTIDRAAGEGGIRARRHRGGHLRHATAAFVA